MIHWIHYLFLDKWLQSIYFSYCNGADEMRGMWIHLQGFYSGTWSQNKLGSCNDKQVQHSQDKE